MIRKETSRLLIRIHGLLDRIEALLSPPRTSTPPWKAFTAFRWSLEAGLQGIRHPHRIALEDLLRMDRQKAELVRNTRQFVAGRPANNALLWGSRGTGKSSLVKAVLGAFSDSGLRVIEVDKSALLHMPELLEPLYDRPERFILFCDDLSFEAEDPAYKALKAVLEGTVAAPPQNVLIYATSNRRHLMPEYMSENLATRPVDSEIHQGDAVEEKISLSERFGLCLSFYPFTQDDYLAITRHWLQRLSFPFTPETQTAALQWATQRGSRSGRVARQFAVDWCGRHQSNGHDSQH